MQVLQIGKSANETKWILFAFFAGTHFGKWAINGKSISVQTSALKVAGREWRTCHLGFRFY